jgi:hypothetical protein
MANQVTLTFAGDPAPLSDSFKKVGDDAQKMGRDVGDAYDNAAERSDALDTRAMGFRDTLTGIQDGALGVKQAASGDWGFETLLLLGTGVGDLASGMTNFLIPALKSSRLGTLATAAATNVASAATKAFTFAQNLLKVAFLTSPIGWIVLGIGALIAVVVLIATKTTWFQTLWRNAWSWIKTAAANSWEFIKKIPGWIGTAFAKVAGFITAPYRAAFNAIARMWNNTVGGLSFTVPGWVPGIGGNGFSVPKIPTFHSGGIVPGVRGTLTPIMAIAGERVSGLAGSGGAGAMVTVAASDEMVRLLLERIAAEVRSRGGDAATVGIRIA